MKPEEMLQQAQTAFRMGLASLAYSYLYSYGLYRRYGGEAPDNGDHRAAELWALVTETLEARVDRGENSFEIEAEIERDLQDTPDTLAA